jgi:hypothetical protein
MIHGPSPRRIVLLAAAAFGLVAIGAGGCFRSNSALLLQPDGSGTLRLTYAMPEAALNRMEKARAITRRLQLAGSDTTDAIAPPPAPLPVSFREEEVRALLAPYTNSGIALRNLNVASQQDWRTVQMELAFKRLEDLARLPLFSSMAMSLRKNQAGNYIFTLEPLPSHRYGAIPNSSAEDTRENLTALLAGLSVILQVTTPGTILDANAADRMSRTARWAFLFDQDPHALSKLGRRPLTVLFQGAGLSLPEFDKPAQP